MFTSKKYSNIVGLAIIAVLIISIYYKSLNNQFLNDWDDGIYITNNQDIKSDDAVKKAFTAFSNGHYHPLTTLSYITEFKLFGLNPKPYHTTNLILHILNAFLVFALVWLLVKQSLVAFITALLFAIHPLHVESVAWISDRKDLLCTLFFIGALCTYIIYHKDKKNNKFYIITFLLFILALLSKAMAVTLPVLFFVIDYFMDRKFSRKTVIEKIPFLALSVVFGYISIISQKSNDALGDLNTVSFLNKILFSSYSIIMYVVKLFSFSNLSAFYNYPLTENGKYPIIFYLAPIILAIVVWLIYKIKNNNKIVWFGLGFFLVTIVLVLQIIPAGNVIMADRYTYLPYIGLFFIIASLVNGVIESGSKAYKSIAIIGLSIFVFTCSFYSFMRTKVWHDSMTFWNNTIEESPDAALPYSNRAALFIRQNQTEKAIADLNHAIQIRPKYVTAHYNRGMAYMAMGKNNEAINDFSMVLQNKCRDIVAVHMNRGDAYMNTANYKNAIEDYSAALSYNPGFIQAYYNRAIVYYTVNQFELAIRDCNSVVSMNQNFAPAYGLRAISFYKIQDFKHALEDALIAQKMGNPIRKDLMQDLISKTKN